MVWLRPLAAMVVAGLTGLAFSAFNDEVTMSVEPVWGLRAPTGVVYPVRVTVENTGPDRVAQIEAQASGISRVQIDLPRNSVKEVILYPPVSQYNFQDINITLSTQGGRIAYPLRPSGGAMSDSSLAVVALISDNPGGFSFLSGGNVKGQRFTDAYAKPGACPDRTVGYDAVSLVFLGEGAERLTDREVEALKRFALTGGGLIFMGGASSPILRDPRWQDVLPITNPRAASLNSIGYLGQFGSAPTGPIAVMNADAKPGSVSTVQAGIPVMTKRAFGIGTVFVLGFNLTEQPLSRWAGRLELINNLLLQKRKPQEEFVQTSVGLQQYQGGYSDPYGYSSYPGMASSPISSGDSDPFRAQLPPVEKVAMILLGFWVVVIPIHFFILNRLKKGELAWFTAPIIALAFAGILFTMASGLYKAGLSTSLDGVLFRADGSPAAMFLGRQQLFFPSGGRYNLGLTGVEAVMPVSSYTSFAMPGRSNDTSFQSDLQDIGEIVAPSVTATNLNFKEFRFAEKREEIWSVPAEISVTRRGNHLVISGRLINQSTYPLDGAGLLVAGQYVAFKDPDLKPSETHEFSLTLAPRAGMPTDVPVALHARFRNFEAGARIGRPAPRRFQEVVYSYGTFPVKNQ